MNGFLHMVLLVLPGVLCRPPSTTTTMSPEASLLGLSASADLILEKSIDVEFSCADRRLGYYADIANDCRIFHICNPTAQPDGRLAVLQYSFFCPAGTQFHQPSLSCMASPLPIQCNDSERYYHVNDDIGDDKRIPQEVRHSVTGPAGHSPNFGGASFAQTNNFRHQTIPSVSDYQGPTSH